MSSQVRLAVAPAAVPRPSARVRRVAEEFFDSDESQVRRLIREGELEAHRIGTRGVRVYLDSVADYQHRRTVKPVGKRKARTALARKSPDNASTSAHLSAVEELRRSRIV